MTCTVGNLAVTFLINGSNIVRLNHIALNRIWVYNNKFTAIHNILCIINLYVYNSNISIFLIFFGMQCCNYTMT